MTSNTNEFTVETFQNADKKNVKSLILRGRKFYVINGKLVPSAEANLKKSFGDNVTDTSIRYAREADKKVIEEIKQEMNPTPIEDTKENKSVETL